MLYTYINEYQKQGIYPFHMPGHKRNQTFFKDISFLDWDVTEFAGTDNLHNPQGCIQALQQQFATRFGSSQSHLLVNGSSVGLLAAIRSICDDGDQILIARNCHRSVYNALLMADMEPIYLYPEKTSLGLIGGIDPLKVMEQLKLYPNIRGVVITSPTYEGFCSDIAAIATITKQHHIPLIVDEAHGAHFVFSNQFPQSAVKYADMVIQSLHKTLPMFGQSAILHSNLSKKQDQVLQRMLSMLQTTSPSYMMMCGMDYSLQQLVSCPQYFEDYLSLLNETREGLKNSTYIQLLGKECIGKAGIFDMDISKLVFFLHTKLAGTQMDEILAKEYGLQMEFSSLYHLIALSSVCDTKEGFGRLKEAIFSLDRKVDYQQNCYTMHSIKSTVMLTPKVATKSRTITMLFTEAIGQIAAEFVIPYPPGIPLLVPGEIITTEVVEQIRLLKANGISFIGCADTSIEHILVVRE